MATTNPLKRYLDAGMQFTSINQAKAEALVKEFVKSGELQAEHAQATVNDLLERSRKNTEAFLEQILKDIAAQADSLGLATLADITRLEKLIAALGRDAKTATKAATKTVTTTVTKAAPAKKAAAKKAPAKKAPATKAPAKKAPAKKAPAKKSAS